ncbi:hypothetical protein D3C85_1804160 [compost metagenome]
MDEYETRTVHLEQGIYVATDADGTTAAAVGYPFSPHQPTDLSTRGHRPGGS